MITTLQDSRQLIRDSHKKSHQERFHIYQRRFQNFLGRFNIGISRAQELSNGALEEYLEIQLSVIPDPRWLKRALQLCVSFDQMSTRQSLCQIKLSMPGVREWNDPMTRIVRNGTLEDFIGAMNDGKHRPDDLYCGIGDPRSLLNVGEISCMYEGHDTRLVRPKPSKAASFHATSDSLPKATRHDANKR